MDVSSFLQVVRYLSLKARLLDDKGGAPGGCVRFIMGRGDLRTLLFAGGQGLASSTFSHVGGLPDLFMEYDVGALTGSRKPKPFQELLSIDRQNRLQYPSSRRISVFTNLLDFNINVSCNRALEEP